MLLDVWFETNETEDPDEAVEMLQALLDHSDFGDFSFRISHVDGESLVYADDVGGFGFEEED